MKVHVEFTVDVDPAAWVAEHGSEPLSLAEVRQDVKAYLAFLASNYITDRSLGAGCSEGG